DSHLGCRAGHGNNVTNIVQQSNKGPVTKVATSNFTASNLDLKSPATVRRNDSPQRPISCRMIQEHLARCGIGGSQEPMKLSELPISSGIEISSGMNTLPM